MRVERKILFYVVMMLVLFGLLISIAPQALTIVEGAKSQITPRVEEKQQVLEESYYKSIGATDTDTPTTIIYKLFRNFDPLFLNETTKFMGFYDYTIYNSFILDLQGNRYNYKIGNLTNMTMQGIKNFSAFNQIYQVGDDSQKNYFFNEHWNPGVYPDDDSRLDFYNNDCWTPRILDELNDEDVPCKIFVSADSGATPNEFSGRVKIKVGWHKTGVTSSDGRQIIYVAITICDDETVMV